MSINFVSDNYYLCNGIKSSLFNTRLIQNHLDIEQFFRNYRPYQQLVVAINNLYLLDDFISRVNKLKIYCIVLMQDVLKDHAFRIGNITFSSLYCSAHFILNISHQPLPSHLQLLTQREMDFMDLFHLQNVTIAKTLDISQKTASGHRINIQNKLRMKSRNSLAMLRMKSVLSRIYGHASAANPVILPR